MDPNDKVKIRANFRYIVGQIRVGDIRDYLYEKGVLNEDDFEELEPGRKTERNNVRTLLMILLKKGNTAYELFCAALNEENKYSHVVDTLEETDLQNVKYESPDELDSFLKETGNFVELQRLLWQQTEQLDRYKRDIDRLQDEHKELKTSKEDLKTKFEELEVQIKSKGPSEEYIIKCLGEYMAQQDRVDGSMPLISSPARRPLSGLSHAESQKDVAVIAVKLSHDIITFLTAPPDQIPPAPNKYAVTMRRTVALMMEHKSSSFVEFMENISFSDAKYGFQMLTGIADEMFSVGENNWGRVVALYAFAGFVAKHSTQNKMTSINSYIGDYLGQYVAKNLSSWIEQKGGWDDFEEFFADKEAFGWKGLFLTAIALGALASFVSVRGSS